MICDSHVVKEPILNPERFECNVDYLQEATAYATDKVASVMKDFVHLYPTASSLDLKYKAIEMSSEEDGSNWTHGFFTGMLWLSYELTGNELYRAVAEAQFDDYKERYDNYSILNHHDIGFLYTPSAVAQYKLTGAAKARELGIKAADVLANRYSDVAKIIQVRDRNGIGEFIIDCTMNIPLLFWAAVETGDRSYFLKALNHVTNVTKYMVREDGGTYQCAQIDEVTGEYVRSWSAQGFAPDSYWARGQAWGVYGFALCYKYTHDPAFLSLSKKLANYFLNRLPSDLVCNWDLVFTKDTDQRDTSAAATLASGLLELARALPEDDEEKVIYQKAANAMMYQLHTAYTTKGEDSNGILMHGVYCRKLGHDECCIWGDYFYLETLLRLKEVDWDAYW